MILPIFALLVGICLVLIIIGLTRPTESYCALVGFFLLFLLSFNILDGTLQYKVGSNTTFQYGDNFTGYHWDYDYDPPPNEKSSPSLFHIWEYDNYENFQSKPLGYWLCVISAIGFIGVLFSLKKSMWEGE